MTLGALCLLTLLPLFQASTIERLERVRPTTWHLGMNLNPADGHIMSYTNGWTSDAFIGTYADSLTKDYLNRAVWRQPVSYIAIVRHQQGEVDAVKVFRFKEEERTMLSRFQDMNPGREVVTEGGPIQESVSANAQNLDDDPIFSVGGDLAFNWAYSDNGHRIVLTGGNLSPVGVNDDNTHGLGNHFACDPLTGSASGTNWGHEISNIHDSCVGVTACTYRDVTTVVQGTDHGAGYHLRSGPVYGNYAIYVSKDATLFPGPGFNLELEVNVESKLRFFEDEL